MAPLIQDSGEDRGEASDGGVGVAGQPEKRLSGGRGRELDESLSQTQSYGGPGGGRGELVGQSIDNPGRTLIVVAQRSQHLRRLHIVGAFDYHRDKDGDGLGHTASSQRQSGTIAHDRVGVVEGLCEYDGGARRLGYLRDRPNRAPSNIRILCASTGAQRRHRITAGSGDGPAQRTRNIRLGLAQKRFGQQLDGDRRSRRSDRNGLLSASGTLRVEISHQANDTQDVAPVGRRGGVNGPKPVEQLALLGQTILSAPNSESHAIWQGCLRARDIVPWSRS